MSQRPEQPQRALIQRSDGTADPLALDYAGSHDGLDVWVPATVVELRAFDRIVIGPMADKTVVRFP